MHQLLSHIIYFEVSNSEDLVIDIEREDDAVLNAHKCAVLGTSFLNSGSLDERVGNVSGVVYVSASWPSSRPLSFGADPC